MNFQLKARDIAPLAAIECMGNALRHYQLAGVNVITTDRLEQLAGIPDQFSQIIMVPRLLAGFFYLPGPAFATAHPSSQTTLLINDWDALDTVMERNFKVLESPHWNHWWLLWELRVVYRMLSVMAMHRPFSFFRFAQERHVDKNGAYTILRACLKHGVLDFENLDLPGGMVRNRQSREYYMQVRLSHRVTPETWARVENTVLNGQRGQTWLQSEKRRGHLIHAADFNVPLSTKAQDAFDKEAYRILDAATSAGAEGAAITISDKISSVALAILVDRGRVRVDQGTGRVHLVTSPSEDDDGFTVLDEDVADNASEDA